jgi:uncharacterized RDD family membrane protein YckC
MTNTLKLYTSLESDGQVQSGGAINRRFANFDENDTATGSTVAFRVGFGVRFAGAIFDAMVYVVGMSAVGIGLTTAGVTATYGEFLAEVFVVAMTTCEIFWRTSPSKWCLGAEIAMVDGCRATGSRLIARWACKHGPWAAIVLLASSDTLARGGPLSGRFGDVLFLTLGIVQAIVSIGCLLASPPARRALHDYIAGTAVFSTTYVTYMTERKSGFEVEIPIAAIVPLTTKSDAMVASNETR